MVRLNSGCKGNPSGYSLSLTVLSFSLKLRFSLVKFMSIATGARFFF